MKKIINEEARVKELLENGFVVSKHTIMKKVITHGVSEEEWRSNEKIVYDAGKYDVVLLVKHFSKEGLKPKEIKEKIIALYKNYDPLVDYKFVNGTIASVRQRKNYEVSNLDLTDKSFVVTEDTIKFIRDLGLNLKLQRILFTVFCWSKVQSFYKKNYNNIAMGNCKRKLIHESNTKQYCTPLEQREFLIKDVIHFPQIWDEEGPFHQKMSQADFDAKENEIGRDAMRRIVKRWDDSRFWILQEDKFPVGGREFEITEFDNYGKQYDGFLKELKENPRCNMCGCVLENKKGHAMKLCPECLKKYNAQKKRESRERMKAKSQVEVEA